MAVQVQILAVGTALLACLVQAWRWSQLQEQRQRTKAALSSVMFLLAAVTGGIAAYLRAQDDDDVITENPICIVDQEQIYDEDSCR